MLAVGIDTSGLTHAGSVVAAQALLQLNGALMLDILTAGGDPDPAVARAPLHLGQALISGMFFFSSAPLSAHALLGLVLTFPKKPGGCCRSSRNALGTSVSL